MICTQASNLAIVWSSLPAGDWVGLVAILPVSMAISYIGFFDIQVSSCNDFGFGKISAESTPIIVFVVSSTGDGDPPDNSSTFFRDMKKGPSDLMKGIQITILGLGDSNYTSFMHMPREFHRKCRDMGATMFYEYKEADEVDGLDDITEEWVDGLWDVLKKATMGVRL